jgi:hypothetical protein
VSAADFDSVVIDVGKLTQQQIVAEAKRLNAEIMHTPPIPIGFVRHVDGDLAPEEAVQPGGVIVYDYNRLDLVAKLALEILREFSPIKEGTYRDGHRIVVNTPTEIQISNTVEYSRVIEVGARGEVKLRIKNGGGHVYERAERRLRGDPDVGNSVKVSFAFTEIGGSPGLTKKALRSFQWPTLILTAM